MKAVNFFRSICLVLVGGLIFSLCIMAQENAPKKRERIAKVKDEKQSNKNEKASDSELKKLDAPETVNQTAQDDRTDDKNLRREGLSEEEAAIVPYYNNYLKEYRLGPQDVISIEVFGQCQDYCKTGITVPPTARISYPLIREGVLVGGKTVEQVADEITKKLDEYIIEPKVTVTLDKAMSVRYSVMGKVAAPGIRIMDRKVSLYEAIIEAGGISKEGDKKKVSVISFDAQGKLSRKDVNLVDIESGKLPMIFLNPGDQVVVGGKGFTVEKFFDYVGKFSSLRLLFGSPF